MVATDNNSNNATILITENDDGHGIIELSAKKFNATEGDSNFITVIISAGQFGEVRVHTYIHTCTCIHTYVHTHILTYIYTYIHTYIYTYIHVIDRT